MRYTPSLTLILGYHTVQWNPSIMIPLKQGQLPYTGYCVWSQLHRDAYKTTAEMRIPPLIRAISAGPRVSVLEGFHCMLYFLYITSSEHARTRMVYPNFGTCIRP